MPTPPAQRIVYATQPVAPMYAPMYAPAGMAPPVMVMPGSVGPMPMYYSPQQTGIFNTAVYCLYNSIMSSFKARNKSSNIVK